MQAVSGSDSQPRAALTAIRLEGAIEKFLDGSSSDADLDLIEKVIVFQDWLTWVRDAFPQLRPEDYSSAADSNPRLVLLRLMLWTKDRLGPPARLERARLPGRCAVLWHHMFASCLEPPPSDETALQCIFTAYEAGADAWAHLDHLFDPWAGAVLPLRRPQAADPYEQRPLDQEKHYLYLILNFLLLGNIIANFDSAAGIPHEPEFRVEMHNFANVTTRAFELLRVAILKQLPTNISASILIRSITPDTVPRSCTQAKSNITPQVHGPVVQWLVSSAAFEQSRDAIKNFLRNGTLPTDQPLQSRSDCLPGQNETNGEEEMEAKSEDASSDGADDPASDWSGESDADDEQEEQELQRIDAERVGVAAQAMVEDAANPSSAIPWDYDDYVFDTTLSNTAAIDEEHGTTEIRDDDEVFEMKQMRDVIGMDDGLDVESDAGSYDEHHDDDEDEEDSMHCSDEDEDVGNDDDDSEGDDIAAGDTGLFSSTIHPSRSGPVRSSCQACAEANGECDGAFPICSTCDEDNKSCIYPASSYRARAIHYPQTSTVAPLIDRLKAVERATTGERKGLPLMTIILDDHILGAHFNRSRITIHGRSPLLHRLGDESALPMAWWYHLALGKPEEVADSTLLPNARRARLVNAYNWAHNWTLVELLYLMETYADHSDITGAAKAKLHAAKFPGKYRTAKELRHIYDTLVQSGVTVRQLRILVHHEEGRSPQLDGNEQLQDLECNLDAEQIRNNVGRLHHEFNYVERERNAMGRDFNNEAANAKNEAEGRRDIERDGDDDYGEPERNNNGEDLSWRIRRGKKRTFRDTIRGTPTIGASSVGVAPPHSGSPVSSLYDPLQSEPRPKKRAVGQRATVGDPSASGTAVEASPDLAVQLPQGFTNTQQEVPRKLPRLGFQCTNCARASRKCDGFKPTCATCKEQGMRCQYTEVTRWNLPGNEYEAKVEVKCSACGHVYYDPDPHFTVDQGFYATRQRVCEVCGKFKTHAPTDGRQRRAWANMR